jgi:hypothetical protein
MVLEQQSKSDFYHSDTHHYKFSDIEVYHCRYHGKIWILIFQTSPWIIPTKPWLKCPYYLKCLCGTMVALLALEPLSEQLTKVEKRWYQCTLQYICYDWRICLKNEQLLVMYDHDGSVRFSLQCWWRCRESAV